LVLVIYEHTIIGDDCHIDQNNNIGGALKLHDVLSGSLVAGIEGKVIKSNIEKNDYVQ
jgi:serine acetyltransferase